jgi:hypothetical protein
LGGRGALNATNEFEQTAEKLGAPIVKALLGKAAVPDDSPYTTGTIRLLGTKPSQEVMEDCDTLLMVGSSFLYIEFLPKPGKARGVQIELNPLGIGLRYPVEVGLVGDCKRTLEKLLPMLRANGRKSFLAEAQAGMRDWRKMVEKQAGIKTKPMKPAVGGGRIGQAAAGRRDRKLRLWHHRNLVDPAHPCQARPAPHRIGKSRHYGLRAALHHRRTDRLSGPPLRGFRGRWRIHDADG